MAAKTDFDAKFARFDAALTAIKAKLAGSGLTPAEQDQVLSDLETHVVSLEEAAR